MASELEIRRQKAEDIANEIKQGPGQKSPIQSALGKCGDDQQLLQEVLALIGESTRTSLSPHPHEIPDPLLNQKIGAYKIHWQLGSGGNGDVYLATRVKEPHQQVAIKLLRLTEGDNEEFRRRFLRERQIVALLNHPYIVKLYDADRTRDGRPYFVMEYVEGESVHTYVNAKRLSIRQRLELFVKICDAVQYLHEHLIVHRDLKPGNLLVDTDGNPKILDFGIAKLLRPELMDGELITLTKRHPLTAQYASPEQWEGRLITSASDVYSLGIVLFELLTGVLPVPWTGKSYAEYQKIVCEGELPPPSQSASPEQATLCAEASAASLARRLKGDLDAIVTRALRKDVNERYATATALAEDIRRHLNFVPVRARGGNKSYRVKRFLRRNRPWVVSIAATLFALFLGLIATLMQRNEARLARVEAEHQRERAVQEAARVREMAEQQKGFIRQLQSRLDGQSKDTQNLRDSIKRVVADFRRNVQDESLHGKTRGDSGDRQAADVSTAKNLEVLSRLLALTGDREAAHKAGQACATILERVQRDGDVSGSTETILARCRIQAKTP